MRDGILLVDKSPGPTSHDVVQAARRLLGQKRIGHCGTLDPDATGLLLLTLGQATRLTRFLLHAPKVYCGVIRLGVRTDTHDASGKVLEVRPTEHVSESVIDRTLEGFLGEIEQRLPAYSARKVGGVRLYELARRGEEVPEITKKVTVYRLERTGPFSENGFPFHLASSSGTYARAIAHELGQRLGCGGHLESLRRLEIGPFSVERALGLEELGRRLQQGASLDPAWIPLREIPLPFSSAMLDASDERRVRGGQTVLIRNPSLGTDGDWVRLTTARGELLGVGTIVESMGRGAVRVVQPRIVFTSAP